MRTLVLPGLLALALLQLVTPAPAAAQVGVWDVHGRATGTGVVTGSNEACQQTAPASRRVQGTLTINEDGTYSAPGGTVCRGSSVVIPDEVGTWTPGRRGRIVLEPTNVEELKAALSEALTDCTGARVSIRRLRMRYNLRATNGGQELRGGATIFTSGRLSVAGITCFFRINAAGRLRGTPAAAGAARGHRRVVPLAAALAAKLGPR